MYKVLYLTQFAQIGGGETILLSLLTKLDKKIFEPTVIVTKKGQLSKALSKLKIKTYTLDLSPYLIRTLFIPGMSPVGIYKFIKLASEIKPDLIHVNHLNLALYARAASTALNTLPGGRQVPVVATAHGNWDCIYFYQDIINQFCTDKILANTQELSKNLTKRKILNPKKVVVCPFGVDTALFKPATSYQKLTARKLLGLPGKDFIVTIVGRLDPVKDHMTFLKGAKLVQEKLKGVTFFIVGSKLGNFTGQENNYNNRIEDFLHRNPELAKKVIFGGFISHMPWVYQSTDVLVSSSTSESFGLALLEASACEIPIVSTNVGGQSLIVKNGITGYLIPPKNPRLMAQKLHKIATNKKLAQRFGKNGRLHVSKNFSLEKYTKKVQNFYLYSMHKEKWPKT